jgi:hypothetical protein
VPGFSFCPRIAPGHAKIPAQPVLWSDVGTWLKQSTVAATNRCRLMIAHASKIDDRTFAATFNSPAGLPSSDEQKKTRLRSHLSA